MHQYAWPPFKVSGSKSLVQRQWPVDDSRTDMFIVLLLDLDEPLSQGTMPSCVMKKNWRGSELELPNPEAHGCRRDLWLSVGLVAGVVLVWIDSV